MTLGNSTWLEQNRTIAACGAPNTIRCPGWALRELAAHEISWSSSAKIHRTVRCATGLSGETMEQWSTLPNGRLRWLRRNLQRRSQKSICNDRIRCTVWCATGLSGAAKGQTTSTVNHSKLQRSADVELTRQWTVECPVHHRTVRCAHRHNG
jgi:hypothetical protein